MAKSDEVASLGFDIDTKALKEAGDAAEKAAGQIGKMGTAADQSSKQSTAALKAQQQAMWGTTDQTAKLNAEMTRAKYAAMDAAQRMGTGSGGVANQAQAASQSMQQASQSMTGMLANIGMMNLGFQGLYQAFDQTIGRITRYVEAMAAAQDAQAQFAVRLRNALGDQHSAQQAMEGVRRIAQEVGVPMRTAADSFLRLARNAEALGSTNAQLLQFSETIQKLGVISGAGAGEIGAAMLQLSQALASGRLNGDELRSIMEQMPALAQAIATGLGRSVGELRAMGAAGELTADRIMPAILSQTERVRREFETLPDTVERAATRAANAVDDLTAALGRAARASEGVRWFYDMQRAAAEFATELVRVATVEEQIVRQEQLLRDVRRALVAPDRAGQIATIEAEIARLRALQEANRVAAEAGRVAEARRVQMAPVLRADQRLRELDEFAKKAGDIQRQTETLNTAITALQGGIDGIAAEEAARRVGQLQRGLQMLEAEARDASDALTKFNEETAAMARGGGGGGTQIETNVRQLQEQLQRQLGQTFAQSEPAARAAAVDRAIAQANTQIEQTRQQIDAQNDLNSAFSRGGDAVRAAQVEIDVLNFRFRNFGDVSTPAIEAVIDRFRQLQTGISQAQRVGEVQRAIRGVAEQIASLNAQIAALGQGPFMQRFAAAATQMRFDQSGAGMERLRAFMAGEQLRALQSIDTLDRERSDAQMRIGAANRNDPGLLIRSREREQIQQAQLNVPPSQQVAVAAAMQRKFDAERAATLAEQSASLREQLEYSQSQLAFAGQTGEELAISTALLDKQRELRQQGVDLASAEAQGQMELTEQIARSNYQLEQRRREAAEMQRIWTVAAEGIQEAITSAFDEAFREGTLSGEKALEIIGNLARRVASQILSATVFTPLSNLLQQFGSQVVTPILSNVLLGGSQIPQPPISLAGTGNVSPITAVSLPHTGGVVGVSGLPMRYVPASVFAGARRMHNGGYVGYDEVPIIARRGEQVLTPEQAKGMGGVVVNVNDFRGSGAPVEMKDQGRGPDGKRLIEITVRDQMRRAIRSGEMDRDMAANFGTARVLTRR